MDENHEVPNKDTGRTVVYVAPEIYTRMDNVETTIGMPSDYYSLGMSLLALWIGEGVLTASQNGGLKIYLQLNFSDRFHIAHFVHNS